MSEARWQRVKDLFQAALELSPLERGAFLAGECADDPGLQGEVESLLAAQRQADGFLSQPAAFVPPPPDSEGRRIGPYRLLGTVGFGGMGIVHRAVRDDDVFHKIVAVKLAHGGASAEHVRRLGQERRILGRLQHPNIATILDGGATEEGQPYLVMEYVEGEPIDAYCEARASRTHERLDMFRTVCAAVHYAHQNLVVHRDLKPQNILVTAEGQPKLLDFGIAKLLAAGLDPDEAPTATILPMMTPEYASPEQVRGQPVTTASDVYSLGVVLYELLTGRRPLSVRPDSLEEIVRTICETEPQAPSVAVRDGSAGAPGACVSAAELRGDLDTIILKSLRKEPSRRYLSALEMAEDIRRHQAGLPVLARKDTLHYRAGKFVGRHRAGVVAVVVLFASVVAGFGATLWQWRRAEANRLRAETRFADVRRLANSLLFEIHDEIRDLPGSTSARQRLVAMARQYLDSLARESQGDLGLQRDLAAAYERLSAVQGGAMGANLGDMPGALESCRKALAIREALTSRANVEPSDTVALARVRLQEGVQLQGMNRLPEAEASFRGATDALEALVASARSPQDLRDELAKAYLNLSDIQVHLALGEPARLSVAKAIEHAEGFRRDHPEDARALSTLAGAYYVDSEGSRASGQPRQAFARVQEARRIQEELLRKDPLSERHVRALLFSLNREALDLYSLGEHPEALRTYRRAVEVAEDLAGRNPKDRYSQAAVMVAYSSLGEALAADDARAAIPALGKAREIAVRLVGEDGGNGFARNELAVIDSNLGRALLAANASAHRGEACRAFARSLETWRGLEAAGPLTAASQAGKQKVEAEMSQCPQAPNAE